MNPLLEAMDRVEDIGQTGWLCILDLQHLSRAALGKLLKFLCLSPQLQNV